MGAALHNALYPSDYSKVALLNIGSEEIKGHETIKKAYQSMDGKKNSLYEFDGYIEGNHIMDGKVNVIVTDGFTGNVALKTAEGTANFISSELKNALSTGIIAKISSFLNLSNLKKFKQRFDPRLYNGAILLGLETPVIKSHGSTDYIGFSNSLDVCVKTVEGKLIDKIKRTYQLNETKLNKKRNYKFYLYANWIFKNLIETILEDIFEILIVSLKEKGQVKYQILEHLF